MSESKPHESPEDFAAFTVALEASLGPASASRVRRYVRGLEEQLEAAQSERVRLEGELFKLDEWASRMPDASFTSDDPRWDWWHRRPRVVSIPATEPKEV